jgi:enoyl-CoA hydratase/carnithine racemase
MGPEMVRQFQEVISALEADEQVRVVVFDSARNTFEANHGGYVSRACRDVLHFLHAGELYA